MSQKSFLCLSFNPFYPLKCVLGAGENELKSVQFLAFLSMAITEDPQRRSEKLKQTKRSVLAVLCEIIVSPLDPFYFYCFAFFCSRSLAVSIVTFAYPFYFLLSFYSLYPRQFSSLIPISTLPAAVWIYLMSSWSGTLTRKWKNIYNINFYLVGPNRGM